MYQQIYKKSYFSLQTEQNIAIINVMTLELEPASIVFSGESSMDFPELQRALFPKDLRKDFEFWRIPVPEYLQNIIIQIYKLPR